MVFKIKKSGCYTYIIQIMACQGTTIQTKVKGYKQKPNQPDEYGTLSRYKKLLLIDHHKDGESAEERCTG